MLAGKGSWKELWVKKAKRTLVLEAETEEEMEERLEIEEALAEAAKEEGRFGDLEPKEPSAAELKVAIERLRSDVVRRKRQENREKSKKEWMNAHQAAKEANKKGAPGKAKP